MMTGLERVLAVIEGRMPDRVPVCLHNFLLAIEQAGVSMAQYRTDARAVAQAHLDALERYGHDCICIDLDTTMLAEAMGAESRCEPGQPGRIVRPAIEELLQAGHLRPADPYRDGRIPVLLEAVERIAAQVGDRVAVRGNCDQAPFALACLVRGTEEFMIDLVAEPGHPGIEDLLEVCYQTHLATHRAVKAAGAHFTSLGDSLAGPDMLSPRLFRRFARPYHERLIRELAAEGIFTVIHICGDTSLILDQLADYPACGFELDYKTDAKLAKQTAGREHVLFGNIDPSGVLARGTAADVTERSRELIECWKPGGRFVLNAGCAIPPTAPPENVLALVQCAARFGGYDPAAQSQGR